MVLEEIAKLRQSRRLPEILRTVGEPGALADAVVIGSRIIEEIETAGVEHAPARVTAFLRTLREALDSIGES